MTPRRQVVSLGRVEITKPIETLPNLTPTPISVDTPSAPKQGEIFKYKTAKDIFRYMMASQAKQLNGHTILEVKNFSNQRIHEHHIKLLLKEYEPETICMAIQKASFHCKHVYSVKLVKYFCKRLKDNAEGI